MDWCGLLSIHGVREIYRCFLSEAWNDRSKVTVSNSGQMSAITPECQLFHGVITSRVLHHLADRWREYSIFVCCLCVFVCTCVCMCVHVCVSVNMYVSVSVCSSCLGVYVSLFSEQLSNFSLAVLYIPAQNIATASFYVWFRYIILRFQISAIVKYSFRIKNMHFPRLAG